MLVVAVKRDASSDIKAELRNCMCFSACRVMEAQDFMG
jgi:hypothetical protein